MKLVHTNQYLQIDEPMFILLLFYIWNGGVEKWEVLGHSWQWLRDYSWWAHGIIWDAAARTQDDHVQGKRPTWLCYRSDPYIWNFLNKIKRSKFFFPNGKTNK